jgi:hypothetical protein
VTPPLDRRSAVLLLLDSLLDYLPGVRSATGQLAASGGAAVGTVASCSNCGGSGKVIGQRIDTGTRTQQACRECGGSGSRRARRGETGSDPMIDRAAKAGVAAIRGRGMERAELDSEIARLERSRRDRAGERSARDAYGWERDREAQRKVGSYAELEAALGWLREASPGRCRLAWKIVYHEPWLFDDGMMEALGETLGMLAERMPERIRVPDRLLARQVATEAGGRLDPRVKALRDDQIREARKVGMPASVIADRWSLTVRSVHRITATGIEA